MTGLKSRLHILSRCGTLLVPTCNAETYIHPMHVGVWAICKFQSRWCAISGRMLWLNLAFVKVVVEGAYRTWNFLIRLLKMAQRGSSKMRVSNGLERNKFVFLERLAQ